MAQEKTTITQDGRDKATHQGFYRSETYNINTTSGTPIEDLRVLNTKFSSLVAELRILENLLTILVREYEINFRNQKIPMERGFIQEEEKLVQRQKQELVGILRPLQKEALTRKHQAELADLKNRQKEQRKELQKELLSDVTQCHDKILTLLKEYVR